MQMYFPKPKPQSSDTGDKKLIKWDKREKPIIPHPPENMKLTGFRDPYIIQRGDGQNKWKMLLGSGIEGQGGTLLVYEASQLDSGSRATHALAPAQRQPLFTSVFMAIVHLHRSPLCQYCCGLCVLSYAVFMHKLMMCVACHP